MMLRGEGATAIKLAIKWSTVNMWTLKGGKKFLPHFNLAPEHFDSITALLLAWDHHDPPVGTDICYVLNGLLSIMSMITA